MSLTPEGQVRWTRSGAGRWFRLAFVDHGRLWAHVGLNGVQVLDAADGALIATHANPVERFFAGERTVIGSLWTPGAGGIVLTAFDALDGRQLWVKPYYPKDGASLWGYPLLLEHDELMLVLRIADSQQESGEIVFFDSAGNELSSRPAPAIVPALQPTRGFSIFHAEPSSLTGFDAKDATFKWLAEPLLGGTGNLGPMVAAERLYSALEKFDALGQHERRLEARDVSDARSTWSVPLDSMDQVVDLWLTARPSLLVDLLGSTTRSLSERSTSDGSLLYQCPLDPLDQVAAIGKGRVYVNANGAVVAYSVPGLEIARSGWVSREGNPGRSNRPW